MLCEQWDSTTYPSHEDVGYTTASSWHQRVTNFHGMLHSICVSLIMLDLQVCVSCMLSICHVRWSCCLFLITGRILTAYPYFFFFPVPLYSMGKSCMYPAEIVRWHARKYAHVHSWELFVILASTCTCIVVMKQKRFVKKLHDLLCIFS